MLGQINSSQITKTITWVFIRVNPLGQKLAIFLSSLLSQSDLLVSLCFFCHVFSGRSWVFPGRTVPKNKNLWYTNILLLSSNGHAGRLGKNVSPFVFMQLFPLPTTSMLTALRQV